MLIAISTANTWTIQGLKWQIKPRGIAPKIGKRERFYVDFSGIVEVLTKNMEDLKKKVFDYLKTWKV